MVNSRRQDYGEYYYGKQKAAYIYILRWMLLYGKIYFCCDRLQKQKSRRALLSLLAFFPPFLAVFLYFWVVCWSFVQTWQPEESRVQCVVQHEDAVCMWKMLKKKVKEIWCTIVCYGIKKYKKKRRTGNVFNSMLCKQKGLLAYIVVSLYTIQR